MKILIAEDDMVSRRVLQATLQKWGHEVIIAQDGVEALAAFQLDNGQPAAAARHSRLDDARVGRD